MGVFLSWASSFSTNSILKLENGDIEITRFVLILSPKSPVLVRRERNGLPQFLHLLSLRGSGIQGSKVARVHIVQIGRNEVEGPSVSGEWPIAQQLPGEQLPSF